MEEIDQGPKQIQTAKEFLFSSEPVMYKGIVIKDDEISSTAVSFMQTIFFFLYLLFFQNFVLAFEH